MRLEDQQAGGVCRVNDVYVWTASGSRSCLLRDVRVDGRALILPSFICRQRPSLQLSARFLKDNKRGGRKVSCLLSLKYNQGFACDAQPHAFERSLVFFGPSFPTVYLAILSYACPSSCCDLQSLVYDYLCNIYPSVVNLI